MSGGHSSTEEFHGWQKTFNTTTSRGRLNVALASFALYGVLIVAYKLKPKKSEVKTLEQKSP